MKKTLKINAVIAIINLGLFFTLGLTSADGISLKFAGGFAKGTYHQIGRTLNQLPGFKVSVQETNGSQDNINRLASGTADIGLAQMDVFMKMTKENPSLINKIKVLIPIYTEEVHIIANRSIKKLRKIKNAKINIGPKGSGIEITAKAILTKLGLTKGITLDQSKTKDALNSVMNNELDLMFIVAGSPIKILKTLSNSETSMIQLLPIGKKARRKLLPNKNAYGAGFPYSYKRIRKGSYPWVKKTIRTISVDSVLLVRNDLDSATVSQLISKIFRNKVELVLSHKKWGELELSTVRKSLKQLPSYFHTQVVKSLNSL